VIDAPLLVELGDHRQMDKLIVVTSTRKQQIERLKERDGINREEALRMFSSQMSVEDKVKLADFVIRNEGSYQETKKKTREIFQELRKVVLQTKKRR
jgi:dephospho-CoA kinase